METRIYPESALEAANCESCGSGNVLDASAQDCADCAVWRDMFFSRILDRKE